MRPLLLLLSGCVSLTVPGRPHKGALPEADAALLASAERIERHVHVLATEIGYRDLVQHPRGLRAAADYIDETWKAQGYTVERHEVDAGTYGTSENLVVVVPGMSAETLVVGAHYDAWWQTPGADDNAVGVAALLELTRALRDHEPHLSLRFVAWTNEEYPFALQGSREDAARLTDPLYAAISIEGMGYYDDAKGSQRYPFPFSLFYPNTGTFVGFVANPRSKRWLRVFAGAFRDAEAFPAYGATAPPFLGTGRSDHASYWHLGPGLVVTDTAEYRSPHYHGPSDTEETIDPLKVARVTRGLIGAVRQLSASPP